MQPNLAILAHHPGALTEPEDALKAGGLDASAVRLAQDDIGRHMNLSHY
jgi:hypothetical protein